MQVPILSGIYTDANAGVRTAYPVNLMPVPKMSGVSDEYLRPAEGIAEIAESASGVCRGGINWNGTCYRVMGEDLVTVSASGAITVLGSVGASSDPVSFAYSFDRLAIASGGSLYYWNGTTLTTVTDGDLGTVLDVIWIDGYFMTTDGEFLVVTELTDPTAVDALKYGSSEVDPDPVKAVLKIRNEAYAVNRHTIEAFDNVGGDFFPFQRIDGAQIQKGAIGTHACCEFMGAIAFLGGGRNEPPAIYLGINAGTQKISTPEIDELLTEYAETDLAQVIVESRVDAGSALLYVHLPDRTLVYDGMASPALEQHIWATLTSAHFGLGKYRARHFVWENDRWTAGDTNTGKIGRLSRAFSSHWGATVRWEFSTRIGFNNCKGVIMHQLELVATTGRTELGDDPLISTSYSFDGLTWSQDRTIRIGTSGQTQKRLVWLQQGHLRNWRIQRFRGDSTAHASFLRLEIEVEPLGA